MNNEYDTDIAVLCKDVAKKGDLLFGILSEIDTEVNSITISTPGNVNIVIERKQ